ncbi:alpha/beta hydrolase [Bacillus sp. BGMRC 2118]|nr:alpha/beta hydrolase [Bacillus sp. BGMRC 2118]
MKINRGISFMRKHFLKIDEKHITYYEYGKPGNTALVLLHGLAGSAIYSYAEVAPLLAEKFHVVAIDLPGHGETSPFQEERQYLFSEIAIWLNAVLENILDEPFIMIGHSWGADVALHFTKHFPSNVKGVILLDGGFTFPAFQDDMTFEKAYSGWEEYMENSTHPTIESIKEEYKTYSTRGIEELESMVESIIIRRDEAYELIASKSTVLSIIKSFFQEPFKDTYSYIQVPLLLLHATNPRELDTARKKGIAELRDKVQDVTVMKLEDTGHMLQWDRPKTVIYEIDRWIVQKKLGGLIS